MPRATYADVCHGRYPGIDYSATRPFERWSDAHLEALAGGWLQDDPPCLDLATLAHDELARRGRELKVALKFAGAGEEPVGWLEEARRAVLAEFPPGEVEKRSGRGGVYVILRAGYSEQNGRYGAYVGSTRKSVEKRFLEHRRGIRAGRGLRRFGIELLYSLFDWIEPPKRGRDALLETETRLHEALARVVPKVTGDVAF